MFAAGLPAVVTPMNEPSLRILHVVTHSRLSGAEINMLRLCRGLQERGHTVSVVTRARSSLTPVLTQEGIPHSELNIQGKGNLLAPVRLWGLFRTWQPDVVNTHNSTASLWGGMAGRWANVPVVAHVQGICHPRTLRWCYRRSDALIGCSEAVRRHTLGCGFSPEHVHRVYNAVDPEEFTPSRPREDVRQELGLAVDHVAVGTFAHLSVKKGHADLLDALALLTGEAARQTRLICVGEGGERERLEQQCERLGLTERVRFLGYRRDVADLMAAMDIMALPSHREPFGIVYVEAMLCGLPVIACDAGGAPEVVVPEETGLLVPPRSPKPLARALTRLATEAALRHRLGEAGRRRARQRFSLATMVAETEGVYRTLLKSPVADPG